MAGAYGPVERIPLLTDLMGPRLLDLAAIASSRLGFPWSVFQNDGGVLPCESRSRLLTPYCQAIRATRIGYERCLASDCQGVDRFALHHKECPDLSLREAMKRFAICEVPELTIEQERVHAYSCHGGLVYLTKPVRLDFGDGLPSPIGAVWGGEKRVRGYSLDDCAVRKLAEDICCPEPEMLLSLYHQIDAVEVDEVRNEARDLVEAVRAVEESISAMFHTRMQTRYDQLAVAALGSLRESLSPTRGISSEAIQEQLHDVIPRVLRGIAEAVGKCYAALCEFSRRVPHSGDAAIRVHVVPCSNTCGGDFNDGVSFDMPRDELEAIVLRLYTERGPITIAPGAPTADFLTRLRDMAGFQDIGHALLMRIPTRTEDTRIICALLLGSDCRVVTPGGSLLPAFEKVLGAISDHIDQTVNMACLLAKQNETVGLLEKRTRQLEENKELLALLLQNVAHQMFRPIMELKQSAYILTQRFSKEAYESFRSSLTELERAASNFRLYERLTTDLAGRADRLRQESSLRLGELLREAQRRIEPHLRSDRRNIQLKYSPANDWRTWTVRGNRDAVLESIVNVLDNAVKYSTGNKPIEVDVRRGAVGEVDIRITNYGVGLRDEDCERIFESGYRAESAKEVPIEGSGIGLYVARELTRLYGGHVRAEPSKPVESSDYGTRQWRTTFVISLRSEDHQNGS